MTAAAAYILVQAEPGANSPALAEQVARIPGVTKAEHVNGAYDLIVEVDGSSIDAGADHAAFRIHEIDGVLRAIPLPIVGTLTPPSSEGGVRRDSSNRKPG